MFKSTRTSKIVPPFKWHLNKEHFLGKEHWLRYKVMKELVENDRLEKLYGVKVIDERYEYYFQAFNGQTFLIGTDDSGKYFTQFMNIRASQVLDFHEAYDFRAKVFSFDLHHWETEKIWKAVENAFSPTVRLQGDLTVRFFNVKKYFGFDARFDEYFAKYIAKRALKNGDVETYLAMSNTIPSGFEIFGKLNPREYYEKEKLEKYVNEVLNMHREYRVYWGQGFHKHKIEFKGFRLARNRFLVQPPALKIEHKEHGVTEFEIVYPVVMLI